MRAMPKRRPRRSSEVRSGTSDSGRKTEQQRLATLSVATDAEAEAKRKSEEAEQQRLATLSVAAQRRGGS